MNKTNNPIIKLSDNSTGVAAKEYILLSEYKKLEDRFAKLSLVKQRRGMALIYLADVLATDAKVSMEWIREALQATRRRAKQEPVCDSKLNVEDVSLGTIIETVPPGEDRILHVLWSKAVGTKDYVKSEWIELEKLVWDGIRAKRSLKK